MKAGVIDPTKVTRTALQNTASIAGLMLTTEAMISEIPEKKNGIEMTRWEIMFAAVDGDHCVEETIRQHS